MNHFHSERSQWRSSPKKGTCPAAYQATFSKRQVSFLQAQHVGLHIFGGSADLAAFAEAKSSGFISDPRSRQLAALPADSQLEKGRSPPRPLRPLGSGGPDSALRLVTCWSSDALRLSSSGRTGRFHPPLTTLHAVELPKSRCSLRFPLIFLLDPPSSSQTLSATLARKSKKSE